jgi:hypothetical protein
MYLMKLPADGPKYGPKHVAVIKLNQCQELDLFYFQIFVVLTATVSKIILQQN